MEGARRFVCVILGLDVTHGYRLLDAGDFRKLEEVGPYRIIRPAAGAVWSPRLPAVEWQRADAEFERFRGGDGTWTIRNASLRGDVSFPISILDWQMRIRLTDFGHLGIFPEQHDNWQKLRALIEKPAAEKEFRVLNLFAYTGGSTLACAAAGAHVVHLDASKTTVTWAHENADLAGLGDRPVRWITDDVKKFVGRENRRQSKYHGIILDPPSYGRGPKGETWKIEEDLPVLLADLRQLLAEDFEFFLLSAHSQGYTPIALENILAPLLPAGHFESREMTIDGPLALPSGASCLYRRNAT